MVRKTSRRRSKVVLCDPNMKFYQHFVSFLASIGRFTVV